MSENQKIRKVTVEIPEEVWEGAEAFVPNGADPEKRLSKLISAAFEEWVGWMDGSFRPTSVSELETKRAFELYNRLFLEEVPSADHLGGLLTLPLGRARYLMQTLSYRHGHMLQKRQEDRIRAALENSEKDSTGQRIVVIDAGCREIFDRAVRVLRAENKIGSDTTGEIVRSGVRYKMGEAHLDALKEEFAREEGSRNGE